MKVIFPPFFAVLHGPYFITPTFFVVSRLGDGDEADLSGFEFVGLLKLNARHERACAPLLRRESIASTLSNTSSRHELSNNQSIERFFLNSYRVL